VMFGLGLTDDSAARRTMPLLCQAAAPHAQVASGPPPAAYARIGVQDKGGKCSSIPYPACPIPWLPNPKEIESPANPIMLPP
jgi:hypothetical protein